MLRFHNYSIVFQEVPDELSLAINITNCPHRCKACHSPHLQENIGEFLTEELLKSLLAKYGDTITCICLMGGDGNPEIVERQALFIRSKTNGKIKTAWYSGKDTFPSTCSMQSFDYIKLGAYVERLGGLDSPTSNQRFYRIDNEEMIDLSYKFSRISKKNLLNQENYYINV